MNVNEELPMRQDKIAFWEERWLAAVDASPMRRRRGGDSLARWNKTAGDFAARTGEKENDEKRKKILAWLRESGALFPGVKVIDIGAGPGNWAIPLAEAGAEVLALEPAQGMIEILGERVRQAGVKVANHQATWQEIDLDALGWRGHFDLVFASMTPGVDGPSMLHKMLAAAKEDGAFCYLSAFAGRAWQEWYGELWRTLFNEELGGHVNDIIHPFNLLYALGYRPEMRFEQWERPISWPRDKAISDFTNHLADFSEMNEEVQRSIADYVDNRLVDGRFQETRRGLRGLMLWDTRLRIEGTA